MPTEGTERRGEAREKESDLVEVVLLDVGLEGGAEEDVVDEEVEGHGVL